MSLFGPKKKLEEMILVCAEAEKNIKNAVDKYKNPFEVQHCPICKPRINYNENDSV